MLDIETSSHITLIYHFHLAKEPTLKAKPFMDDTIHGIFAIRAPSRPTPIGLSVVRLVRVEGNKLFVQDVDVVNGTPLLDVKPYVPQFDSRDGASAGWLDQNVEKRWTTKDDGRFSR
jgi:tRNA-Thr(GGU) m(6)t(6)A37 methyltransferase TsaA